MVRRSILGSAAAVAAALGGSALAQPDWGRAGGAIFATPEPTDASQPDGEAAPVRLPSRTQPFEAELDEAAARHRLDPKLLRALVAVESAHRPHAVSSAGAAGLTQLMPATAQDLGVADRFDVRANLRGGADFLARQIVRFGDLRLALAAYNAGPERVARLGRVPRIAETEAYVEQVLTCYLALAAGRSIRSARDCRKGSP